MFVTFLFPAVPIALAYSMYYVKYVSPCNPTVYKYRTFIKYTSLALLVQALISSATVIFNVMSDIAQTDSSKNLLNLIATLGLPVVISIMVLFILIIYGGVIGILWLIYLIWKLAYTKNTVVSDEDNIAETTGHWIEENTGS